jgi:hypothetical protein
LAVEPLYGSFCHKFVFQIARIRAVCVATTLSRGPFKIEFLLKLSVRR